MWLEVNGEGCARMRKADKWFVVGQEGEIGDAKGYKIINKIYKNNERPFFLAKKDRGWLVEDKDGTVLDLSEYDSVEEFREVAGKPYALVKKGSVHFIVGKDGVEGDVEGYRYMARLRDIHGKVYFNAVGRDGKKFPYYDFKRFGGSVDGYADTGEPIVTKDSFYASLYRTSSNSKRRNIIVGSNRILGDRKGYDRVEREEVQDGKVLFFGKDGDRRTLFTDNAELISFSSAIRPKIRVIGGGVYLIVKYDKYYHVLSEDDSYLESSREGYDIVKDVLDFNGTPYLSVKHLGEQCLVGMDGEQKTKSYTKIEATGVMNERYYFVMGWREGKLVKDHYLIED